MSEFNLLNKLVEKVDYDGFPLSIFKIFFNSEEEFSNWRDKTVNYISIIIHQLFKGKKGLFPEEDSCYTKTDGQGKPG